MYTFLKSRREKTRDPIEEVKTKQLHLPTMVVVTLAPRTPPSLESKITKTLTKPISIRFHDRIRQT